MDYCCGNRRRIYELSREKGLNHHPFSGIDDCDHDVYTAGVEIASLFTDRGLFLQPLTTTENSSVQHMPYEFKYLGNRQCHISKVDSADIDDCFRILREVFTEAWLNSKGENVIQKLWDAKYNLATIELYSLGHAIRTCLKLDEKFVVDKIDLIKTDDPKNWNGAIFELLALNAFSIFHKVIPAKENQPGYDGTVLFKKEKSLRLSVKNYSISKHHQYFLKKSEELKDHLEKCLQDFNVPPVEILINKKTTYPSDGDWASLLKNIHGCFIEYVKAGKKLIRFEIEEWSILLQPLQAGGKTFSTSMKSYTLILSAPFHKNEEKNLFDKLEEACVNIAKHEKKETTEVKNAVIIHLPSIISRRNCEQWVRDYFNQYPDKPVSLVILLQPLVVSLEKEKGTYISMGVSFIARESIEKDFADIIPIDFAFPVGKLEPEYTEQKIFIRETEETAFQVDLINCYVYQHGQHYFKAEDNNGTQEGTIAKVASGIFSQSVYEVLGKEIVLSGIFEPVDRLDIL